jgi:hypothetical protein
MSILERHLEEEPRSHSDQKKRKETLTLPQIIRMKSEKNHSIEKEKRRKGGGLHRRPPLTGPPEKGHRGQVVRQQRAPQGERATGEGTGNGTTASTLLGLLRRVHRL